MLSGHFFEWTPEATGALIDLTVDETDGDTGDTADGWKRLRKRYDPQRSSKPLKAILGIAWQHGTNAAVVEYRYIDQDYRSEHSQYYARAFRRYPSVCHRLHFFKYEEGPVAEAHLQDVVRTGQYFGFVVLRPLTHAPVGKTMIQPPPFEDFGVHLNGAEMAVDIFGIERRVWAAPYVTQDREFTTCGHSTLWMVLRYNHMAFGANNFSVSEVRDLAHSEDSELRVLPHEGLVRAQFMMAFRRARGFNPTLGDVPHGRPDRLVNDLVPLANSGFPPIVFRDRKGTTGHAMVVVGHSTGTPPDEVTFVIHDDVRGPYQCVKASEATEKQGSLGWDGYVAAMPERVYPKPRRALEMGQILLSRFIVETCRSLRAIAELRQRPIPADLDAAIGALETTHTVDGSRYGRWLDSWLEQTPPHGPPSDDALDDFLDGATTFVRTLASIERLEYRTYCTGADSFRQRGAGDPPRLSETLTEHYAFLKMSERVWAVEIVDGDRRSIPDHVIGEILLDATMGRAVNSSTAEKLTSQTLSIHVAGLVHYETPDYEKIWIFSDPEFTPYSTGAPISQSERARELTLSGGDPLEQPEGEGPDAGL